MAFGSDITESIGNVSGRTTAQGYNSADEVRKQYTGYERDDESKLDYAQARYYNSSHGRFTSTDPLTASASIRDPQTFNRYSYTLNSPYKFTDPLGLISSSTGACGNWCSNTDGDSGGGGAFDSAGSNNYDTLETVTIDLNIVYDKEQYTLEQAKQATEATVKDLQTSYAEIGVEFNVTYSAGKGDSKQVNKYGVYGRIEKGAKEGAVNVLLFANNKDSGKSGSMYNPSSQQIFVWEGSMAETPNANNATTKLSSAAIAHEMGHLFFHFAGVPMDETTSNNIRQDIGIGYATNQMRYNPLFSPDPELPDDFNFGKDVKADVVGGKYRNKSRNKPSAEQLLRIGAKRVANHLQ